MVPLLWLGMIPWSVLFRKWCVPWSPPSMPWFKSWPWCYANSPGFLSLTNPNSHPHFKWACVVQQFFEHARSLAWSSSLVYSAQLFAIDYSLHYRHPLDKVPQAKEIGIGSGGQGESAANPSAIADGVLRLTSRQQIPKSKTVASTSLVFCACLARASWLFASQVTRQSGLCIDKFTRNWKQRAKVSPYPNACDILRARLVWVKKNRQEILTTTLGIRTLAEFLNGRRSGCAWQESKRRKFENREKRKKYAGGERVEKEKGDARSRTDLFPSCPSDGSGVVGRYLQL